MTLDRALDLLAARQHGTFSVEQAVERAVDAATVYRRAGSGRYRKLQPKVFAVAGAPDSRLARCMAAVLAVTTEHDPALLSHTSAAHLWGFATVPDDVIHVVSGTHHPGGLDGVRPHRTKALPAHHRTERDGIPVTSPERTLCELASCVGYERLRGAVANAMRRDLVTASSLAATMFELGRIRGKRNLRMILEELSPIERDRTVEWHLGRISATDPSLDGPGVLPVGSGGLGGSGAGVGQVGPGVRGPTSGR